MDNLNKEIRVAGATADKQRATLYLEDGTTLIIQQGDHRLKDLLEAILPITTKGEIAVISLESFSVYAAFEKKSGGLTKFFKVAKDKVSGWFGRKEEPAKVLPTETQQALVDAVNSVANKPDPEPEPLPAHAQDFASVMEHGKPVDVDDEIAENEVMVAVVGNTVIKGVDAIKPLIEHAVKSNTPEAVQRFLERCAAISANRNHTVDDLMRFLEKGDLPLAADGSIIAYKMLNFVSGSKDVFVDVHTGRIRQRVGSYVCVSEALVDLNRRNECSNGLHIARRGYLRSFGGNVCVLCKIDPEDVMVVPHNDPNKVRVKGYHILAQLSDDAMSKLKRNVAMTDNQETLALVHQAINGQHIQRIERVEVTEQSGGGVVITKLKTIAGPADLPLIGSPHTNAAALDDERNIVGAVDPRDLNKQIGEQLRGNAAGAAFTAQTGTKADLIIGDEISEGESTDDEFDETDEEEAENWGVDLIDPADQEAQAAIEGEPLTDDQVSAIISGEPEPEAEKPKPSFGYFMGENPHEEEPEEVKPSPAPGRSIAEIGADLAETQAQKDARIKRERRAAKKTAEAAKQKPVAAPAKAEVRSSPPKPNAASPSKKPAKVTPEPVKAPPAKTTAQTLTKAEQARILYDAWVANPNPVTLSALTTFKKTAKKGWGVLGFSDAEEKKILG